MVAFRKRFSPEDIARILEATVPESEQKSDDGGGDDLDPRNDGTLTLDTTCCPEDIAYPKDINLLNEAWEKLEKTIDEICKINNLTKPRTYRKCAKKDFLRLVKSKKRTRRAMRKAIGKQLRYIRRDIRYVVEFVQNDVKLTQTQKDRMNLVTTVYEQQRIMYEIRIYSIPRRIVSLSQPWVRLIVRGKARANTEFGAKLHISYQLVLTTI